MNQQDFTLQLLRAACASRGAVTSPAGIDRQQTQRERVLEIEWLHMEGERLEESETTQSMFSKLGPQRLFVPQQLYMPYEDARGMLPAESVEILDCVYKAACDLGLAVTLQCGGGELDLVVIADDGTVTSAVDIIRTLRHQPPAK